MNVWLLTNTPSPYQVELLSAIASSGDCRLSVRFLRGEHRGVPWRPEPPPFDYRVLGGVGPRVWADAFRLHPDALREVKSADFDCFVLSGQYTSLSFAACAAILHRSGRPWAMWLERPWPDDYRPAWSRNVSARSGIGRAVRRTILRRLAAAAPRILCVGKAAMEAYAAAGAPRDRLVNLPYHCDVTRFSRVPPADAQAVRTSFGLQGRTVFLFSGQLIARKGVDVLLTAFASVAAAVPAASLLILGDGPEHGALQQSIPALLRDRVVFAGHVEQTRLPVFMKCADVFVFPSRYDGWGVVVNEACAAGLPVIATDGVGATADLVEDGGNGFVVARDDVAALTARMLTLGRDPDLRAAFGRRSLQIVERFSLPNGAAVFCRTLRELAEVRTSS